MKQSTYEVLRDTRTLLEHLRANYWPIEATIIDRVNAELLAEERIRMTRRQAASRTA